MPKTKELSTEQVATFFTEATTHPRLPSYQYSDYKQTRRARNSSYLNDSFDDIKDTEQQILKDHRRMPNMVSYSTLKKAYVQQLDAIKQTRVQRSRQALSLSVLAGCDAHVMPNFKSMRRSVFAVASQFNNGESMQRRLTHPCRFGADLTQGPAMQQTASETALARYVYRDYCNDLAHWEKQKEFSQLFWHEHGFLTPHVGKELACTEFVKTYRDQLMLNLERVKVDGAGIQDDQLVIQLLMSAPALGQYDTLAGSKNRDQAALNAFCQEILIIQYEMLAMVTLLEASANPDKRIPLVLTPIGGGAYGVNPASIAIAIEQACQIIIRSGVTNIDICLSAYRRNEVDCYRSLMPTLFSNAPIITHEQLSEMSALTEQSDSDICLNFFETLFATTFNNPKISSLIFSYAFDQSPSPSVGIEPSPKIKRGAGLFKLETPFKLSQTRNDVVYFKFDDLAKATAFYQKHKLIIKRIRNRNFVFDIIDSTRIPGKHVIRVLTVNGDYNALRSKLPELALPEASKIEPETSQYTPVKQASCVLQ